MVSYSLVALLFYFPGYFMPLFSGGVVNSPVVQNNAFSVGEKIDFKLYFGYLPAGASTLKVDGITRISGRDCYHIVFETKTNSFFDRFFKVRDFNESWIDTRGIFSWRYSKDLNEGRYHKKITTTYDHQHKRGQYGDREIEILPWCQDLLSIYYYLRCLELTAGDVKWVAVNDGGKNYQVKVEISSGGKLVTPAGKFTTLYVKPRLTGKQSLSGSGAVWFTNDSHRIPVKLKIKMSVGTLTLIANRIKYGE